MKYANHPDLVRIYIFLILAAQEVSTSLSPLCMTQNPGGKNLAWPFFPGGLGQSHSTD